MLSLGILKVMHTVIVNKKTWINIGWEIRYLVCIISLKFNQAVFVALSRSRATTSCRFPCAIGGVRIHTEIGGRLQHRWLFPRSKRIPFDKKPLISKKSFLTENFRIFFLAFDFAAKIWLIGRDRFMSIILNFTACSFLLISKDS